MSYWRPIRGVSEPIPIRQFNGVYRPDDEGFNQSEDLMTELINFCPDAYPALTTRPGYSVLGSFPGRVLGFGVWESHELHVVFGDGTWRRWNGSTWTTMASGLSTTAEWSFCNFKGNLSQMNLISSNGVDPIKRYDGSSVQDLANAPAGGNYICTQSNRLYCAVGNILHFSALAKPEDWSTVDDAGQIVYETASGEDINGLEAGDSNVTAFKPTSIRELYGKGPGSYTFEPVAADIGIASYKAVTVNNSMLPMIGRDGIYLYAGGMRPKKEFSHPVHNYRPNPAHLSKCAAGSDGDNIYFAIPYGSSTENSRILQYNTEYRRWYTWDGIAVTHFIRFGADLIIGDATGRVLKMGGTTDAGQPIRARAITKPFTASQIARTSTWYDIWIVASLLAGSTLSVRISPSARGEDWIPVSTLTASNDIQYRKLLVPTNRVSRANAVRLDIEIVGNGTIHEICRRLRELPMGGRI